MLPLVGEIAAGHEHFMEEEIETWISTSRRLINSKISGKYFYLRVSGNSMIGRDIFDGDKVLIRRMSNPRADVHDGDIVACMIGGNRATLKTLYYESDGILLQPENPEYESFHITWEDFAMGDAKIIGVMKGKAD